MGPAPSELLRDCRAEERVHRACPALLPIADSYRWRFIARSGDFVTLDVAHGHPRNSARRDRPPRFVHVVIEAGDLADAYPFEMPDEGTTRIALRDGLLEKRRTQPLLVGEDKWGGVQGLVVLMPGFEEAPTIHANHVMFFAQVTNGQFAISVHAWRPVAESLEALRAIVESTDLAPGAG